MNRDNINITDMKKINTEFEDLCSHLTWLNKQVARLMESHVPSVDHGPSLLEQCKEYITTINLRWKGSASFTVEDSPPDIIIILEEFLDDDVRFIQTLDLKNPDIEKAVKKAACANVVECLEIDI